MAFDSNHRGIAPESSPPGSNRLKMQEPLESSTIFESVVIVAPLAFLFCFIYRREAALLRHH
jgi:hypothetical protein